MSEVYLLVIVGTLDPADEALLEEETTPQPESKRLITTIIEIKNIYNYLNSCLSYRARQHAKNVSWLRRTEYISSELTRSHTSGESMESKLVITGGSGGNGGPICYIIYCIVFSDMTNTLSHCHHNYTLLYYTIITTHYYTILYYTIPLYHYTIPLYYTIILYHYIILHVVFSDMTYTLYLASVATS